MSSVTTVLAIALIVFCSEIRGNAHQRKVEKQIIDNIFSSVNYDPRIRPSGANSSSASVKPLDVGVELWIKKIQRVDDDRMMYSIDTMFRQKWVDERLKYSQNGVAFITLDSDEEIWTPDIFFNDYKGASHDVTKPNTLVRIYPNGSVLHSRRYNLLLYCDMDFRNFPFDRQTCDLSIESYAWDASAIKLGWTQPQQNAVGISKSLINEGFYTLEKFWTSEDNIKVSTGVYCVLKLFLTFKRESTYYTFQIFTPCAMLVIVAYLSLWIHMVHFNTRIILALGTLLTMALQISSANIDVPKTNYTKAIDIYTGLSLSFAMAVLVETVVVYAINARDNFVEKVPKANKKLGQVGDWFLKGSDNNTDAVMKFAFPLVYALFQVLFWSVYL